MDVKGFLCRLFRLRAGRRMSAHVPEESLLLLGVIFFSSLFILSRIYAGLPDMEEDELQFIKLPKNINDAQKLGVVLSKYKDMYFYQVLIGIFVVYIFLQTFAIPGSIFLSILSGYLFPFPLALVLVCLCSAIGASFCYLLSYLVGRPLVDRYFPERAEAWASTVQRHRSNLFNYMLFLRITPFLPNWFINITAPVIDVPIKPFFFGTLFGVAPPSFVAIQAGTTLYQLTSSSDAVSFKSILLLGVFAVLSLIPVLYKSRLRNQIS